MITLNAHALNRVARCNGSHHMPPSEVPDDELQSDDRREGRAAHFIALEVLSGRFTDVIEFVDRKVEGVWITVEMAEAVDPFVQDVLSRTVTDGVPYGATIHIEETVNFQLSPEVQINCRLDLATYDPNTQTLTVDELKYGHRIVEPVDNWQLVAEAMGWIIKHQIAPAKIILNIHQPRPHHPDGKKRSWEFESYQRFEQAYLRMAEKLANITFDTHTGDHCYKCPALTSCTAARRTGYNMVDMSATAFNDKLDNEELSHEILLLRKALARGKGLLEAYEELLTHRYNDGQFFNDWYTEPTYANTRFRSGVTPEMIKAVSGIDITVKKLPTPKQAERAGISPLILQAFTERPSTGFKLVNKTASQVAGKMFKPPTAKG